MIVLRAIEIKFHMSKSLRFWVDVEYERIKNHASGHTRIELIAKIVRKFEQAGDAMRFLNADGRLAWKATPEMLSRLADAEQEARDDELGEWLSSCDEADGFVGVEKNEAERRTVIRRD